MPNPVLNDKTFTPQGAAGAGGAWAPPDPATAGGRGPISDGPVSPYTSYRESTMTLDGTVTATAALFALLLAGGAVGWWLTPTSVDGTVRFPGWLLLPLLAALGVALWVSFRPMKAKLLGPVYAVLEGMVLGAISKAYESMWDGIVLQAIGMTIAVFLVMLVTYRLRLIRVTEKTRSVIIGATLAVMLFYVVSLVMSLFGATPPFISSTSIWGIGFSILVAGIAAFNLLLDFDLIERGTTMGAPKYMEWFAAFGLLVTLVWLYLEILRLLGKLRSN